MSIAAPKSERIEVRTTPAMKALLQRAADSSHKSVTEFLLEAGVNAAEEALVNRHERHRSSGAGRKAPVSASAVHKWPVLMSNHQPCKARSPRSTRSRIHA